MYLPQVQPVNVRYDLLANAANAARENKLLRQTQDLTTAATDATADPTVRSAAENKLLALDPRAYTAIQAQKQVRNQEAGQYVLQGALGLASVPEADRPSMWAHMVPQLKQKFQGVASVDSLPDEYDPGLLNRAMLQVATGGGAGADIAAKYLQGNGFIPQQQTDEIRNLEYLQKHPDLIETKGKLTAAGQQPSYDLKTIEGPDGKSQNVRWNPRTGTFENIGDPFVKNDKNGFALNVGPDGSTSVQFGSAVGQTKVPQSVATDVYKNYLGAQDQLRQLKTVGQTIADKYLTYGGRYKAGLGAMADKGGHQGLIGGVLDTAAYVGSDGDKPEDLSKFNASRSAALQGVEQFFNQYRKEITGAAAAEKELQSLKKAVINSDIGPDEFKARYDALIGKIEGDINANAQRLNAAGSEPLPSLNDPFKNVPPSPARKAVTLSTLMSSPRAKGLSAAQVRQMAEAAGFTVNE